MFGKKRNQAAGRNGMRTTALVTDAPTMAHGHVMLEGSPVGLAVDLPAGGVAHVVAQFVRPNKKRPILGTTLPVLIDPERPDDLDVLWDEAPTVAERVAAQEAALVYPERTPTTTGATYSSAGLAGLSPEHAEMVRSAREENTATSASDLGERIEAAVAEAATRPAPPGKLRGIAVVANVMGYMEGQTDGPKRRDVRIEGGKVWYVFSIRAAGIEPYAVEKAVKVPRNVVAPTVGYPVIIDPSDRDDIEVVWDEVKKLTVEGVVNTVSARLEAGFAQVDEQLQGMAAAGMDVVRMGIEQAPPDQRHLVIQAYRNLGMAIPPEYDDHPPA